MKKYFILLFIVLPSFLVAQKYSSRQSVIDFVKDANPSATYDDVAYLQAEDDTTFVQFPMDIVKCQNLDFIGVYGCPNFDIDGLIKMLESCPKMKEIIIGGCNLTHIPSNISKLRRLERLEFRFNHIEQIPESILKLRRLRALWLLNNPNLDVVQVAKVMGQHNKSIVALDDEQQKRLCNDSTTIRAFTSQQALEKVKQMTMYDSPKRYLPRDIIRCTNLEELSIISWTNIDSDDALQLLSHCKKLKILTIYNCNLTNISAAVGRLKSLRQLYLGNNKIKLISPTIKLLNKLTFVDLNDNPSIDIEQILPILANIPNIKRVDMRRCCGNRLLTNLPKKFATQEIEFHY